MAFQARGLPVGVLARALTVAACVGGASLAAAPMSGCQSGGALSGLMGKSAMDLLAPALKEAANSYVSSISSLTGELANIRGFQDVLAFVEKAEPLVKQASSSYNTLASTTGADRSNLLSAFGPKFDSANSGFASQVNRVKGNSTWGQFAGPVIDKVKLFG